MRNLKLILSYDGAAYHGWQTQPGLRTIQETLETAVTSITGEKVHANASGRTDTGVHALAQVVNFRTDSLHSAEVFMRATNANLPADIVVREATEAPESFDANRDAIRKRYRYVLDDNPIPNLFQRLYACHVGYKLDVAAMKRAASPLVGMHDFRSFETEWPNRASSVRTIYELTVERVGEQIWIEVEADGFLYNMVRAIVGTLINVGRGYWPESKVAEVLAAKDRREAGPTAPAHGLFLLKVLYEVVG